MFFGNSSLQLKKSGLATTSIQACETGVQGLWQPELGPTATGAMACDEPLKKGKSCFFGVPCCLCQKRLLQLQNNTETMTQFACTYYISYYYFFVKHKRG